jgi:hypothetical protein
MKKEANKSGEQIDLFALSTEDSNIKRFSMGKGYTPKYNEKQLEQIVSESVVTECEDESSEDRVTFIQTCQHALKGESNLFRHIAILQNKGYSDKTIKAWAVEAGYSDSHIGNKFREMRAKKGERIRGAGGGRKVKNEGLVNRFTSLMSLVLGEGVHDAKAISAAALAAARLVKEGKVEATPKGE